MNSRVGHRHGRLDCLRRNAIKNPAGFRRLIGRCRLRNPVIYHHNLGRLVRRMTDCRHRQRPICRQQNPRLKRLEFEPVFQMFGRIVQNVGALYRLFYGLGQLDNQNMRIFPANSAVSATTR